MCGYLPDHAFGYRQDTFAVVRELVATFPKLFDGKGPVKPRSGEYRRFARAWGWSKVAFDLAQEEITQIEKVNSQYVTEVFFYLTYLTDKAEVEEKEDKFQEQQRKLKSRR